MTSDNDPKTPGLAPWLRERDVTPVSPSPWAAPDRNQARPWRGAPDPSAVAPPTDTEDRHQTRTATPEPTVPPTSEVEDLPLNADEPAQDSDSTQDCAQCERTRQDAAAEREALVNTLQRPYLEGAQAFERAVRELSQQLVEDTVRLSRMLAEAIVRRSVTVDDSLIVETLVQALKAAGPVEQLTLRCHPEDVNALKEAAPGLAEEISGRPVEVRVQSSDDIGRGGFFVLFDHGVVDAQVETQSGHLSDALMNAVLDHFASLDAPSLQATLTAPERSQAGDAALPSDSADDASETHPSSASPEASSPIDGEEGS